MLCKHCGTEISLQKNLCPVCKAKVPIVYQNVDLFKDEHKAKPTSGNRVEKEAPKVREEAPPIQEEPSVNQVSEETSVEDEVKEPLSLKIDEGFEEEVQDQGTKWNYIYIAIGFVLISIIVISAYLITSSKRKRYALQKVEIRENPLGIPQSDGSFGKGGMLDDLKSGKWEYRDSSGMLLRSEVYNNLGQLIGPVYYYHPNGKIREKKIIDDGKEVSLEEYNEEGRIIAKGEIKDGNRHGIWEIKDSTSNEVRTTYFLNGKEVSREDYTFRYENSDPREVGEGEIKEVNPKKWVYIGKQVDSKRTGVWRVFDPRGVLREELSYEDGKREGISKRYGLKGDGNYEIREYKDNNLISGKWYDKAGRLLSEGNYKNNQREGEWIFYEYSPNKTNLKVKKVKYANGKEVGKPPEKTGKELGKPPEKK